MSRRPNIVMILTDDHAAHAIGAYGSVVNATPRIDKIGRIGVRFDNCFATNSLCSPSRASILTGTYSHIYDLVADPAELHNVYHDPRHAAVRAELTAAMWREQARLLDKPHPSQPRPVGA